MEIVSLVVALGTLALALYTYLKHDKELKAQQKFINKYEIERIKKEVVMQKKADVRVYITNVQGDYNHTGTLVVKNHGKAAAQNIRVDSRSFFHRSDCIPHVEIKELLPEAQQEYPFSWVFGEGGEILVRITWSDKSGKNRTNECTVQL